MPIAQLREQVIAAECPAVGLAQHILCQDRSSGTTHLKLQKLTFYVYGALLAADLDGEVGAVEFEAWQHGPVCRAVYEQYKSHRAAALPTPDACRSYSSETEQCIRDVLAVYGRLSAWQLREQSHLEEPWDRAWNSIDKTIDSDELRRYFSAKFARNHVTIPELLTQAWPLSLDGLPQARFESLNALARALA
jgi:uncharacterized phage-associated protein